MNEIKSFLTDTSNITIDPNLKPHPNPFPRKMAMAVEFIEKHGLPPQQKRTKKQKTVQLPPQPELTTLQKELLTFYTLEPSAEQMEKLKEFLRQLLTDAVQEQDEVIQTQKIAA